QGWPGFLLHVVAAPALALSVPALIPASCMTTQPQRRHVHSRSIQVDAYAREDGLWDVEAVLVDTKSRDLQLVSGLRKAGEPVHEMRLQVTIDTELNVHDASADTTWVPYPGYCGRIEPEYKSLIGLNLVRDFRRNVRERLGGVRGCTHLTELAGVLPTAAIQGLAGEVRKRDAERDDRKPFQLDHCHALVTTAAAVAKFYPRWFRDEARQDTASDTEQGETR